MKQEKDQSTTSNRSQSAASNQSTAGGSGGEKPKGTASPVQFPSLSLPKGGSAIAWLFIFFYSIISFSCSLNSLSPDDYLKWMAEHRMQLSASQRQGDVTATLIYLPADWLSINEAGAQHPEQIAGAQKEYVELEYYRLRLAASSGQGDILQLEASSTDDYYQRVEYFSFGLQNDLRLLVGPDTLSCRLFHFERNYGAAPYMDFMLGFDQQEGKGFDRTLIFYDRVYSNNTIQLTIPIKDITSIPYLKL